MFVLTIDGIDRTELLRVGTFSVNSQLNSRNTCSFTLVDEAALYWPDDGMEVVATDNGATVFAGTIEDTESEVLEGTSALWHTINCVDYNQLAGRRQVAEVYESVDTVTLEPHDNFDDGVIDTSIWSTFSTARAQVLESGGYFQVALIATPGGSNYGGINSIVASNLTGKAAVWQVERWIDANAASNAGVSLVLDSSNALEWSYANGVLSCRKQIATTWTTLYTVSGFSVLSYRWLRIREAAGTIYWDYSADGFVWTNAASAANPFAVTALFTQIYAGTFAALSTQSRMLVSYVNVIPVSQTLGEIVNDIVAKYLADDGVTADFVEAGPFIPKAVFNYADVSAAFDELAELSGFAWWIDYNRKLHFQQRDSNMAPFAITAASENWRKMRVTRTRSDYRNRQIVRAGTGITDLQIEQFTGDGRTKTFVTAYPIAETPLVFKAGVQLTVGVRGVEPDTSVDAQWQRGSNEVNLTTGSAPTSAQFVEIQYRGEYPIIVQLDSTTAIDTRKSVEGGSGIYQMVEEDSTIDTTDMARNKALSLLRKYARIPKTVEFETDTAGLESGQLLTINVPEYRLAGDFLIESVKTTELEAGILRYNVKALDGEILGGWTSFFRRMASQGKTFVIRENEVLFRAQTMVETLRLTDTLRFPDRSPDDTLRFTDAISHTTAAAATAMIGTAVVSASEVEA